MKDFVHLYRKIITSWVFQDPRRLQLFIYLLVNADEKGVVEVNLKDYATKYNVPRSTIRDMINLMRNKGIVSQQIRNKTATQLTCITIIKYGDYNSDTNSSPQQNRNKTAMAEEKEREREGLSSPCTPFLQEKDKEREYKHSASDDAEGESNNIETPSFEQFWDAYAYKKDRRMAEREWRRLSEADRKAAFEGIEAYRNDCRACRRSMMYAQGYLSHRRWEDESSSPANTQFSQQQNQQSQPNFNSFNHSGIFYDGQDYHTAREMQREIERQHRLREAEEAMARLAAKNRPVT